MKNVLFSALLAVSVMGLTTGCSMMGEGGSKCGASKSEKCGADKKEAKKCGADKKEAKKCGAENNGKCGTDKK